ncbi:uncharacterized protein LOC127715637 isoform X2 [Mytilus californianus]|nr:uncharacterized protein LOC127715637 isoform X2 [Mytilus californianus]
MENKDETPEKQLLNIVDWCYKQCTEIFNSQTTTVHEKVWELASILHLPRVKEITFKKNQRINAYDQKGKENAVLIESIESFLQNAKEQRQCSSTLVDSVKKICCDDYGSSNQTTSGREKEFVRKCSELCWYMISADPPMVIEYENFENMLMDSNKFNKYNRTGTSVEYVVWPVLLLHKDGPVLAKGSVQTNFGPKNDRIAARKKSIENLLAPPLACRSIFSDDHVTIPNQINNNNYTKGESIHVQLKTEKTCPDQSDRTVYVIDSKVSSQKDQSILQNKGKPDDDSDISGSGTLKQSNSTYDIRVVTGAFAENVSNIELTEDKVTKQRMTGSEVVDGGVSKSAKLDHSRSRDFNDAQYKSRVDQRTNVSSVSLRNENTSASGEELSTDNSKSDFGEKPISKCVEFMKSEENVVQSIDGDKYNANFLLHNKRRQLQKSQSMTEELDKETKQRYAPNCDNKTNTFNGINRTVSTSFIGHPVLNANMLNTKYYGKPENLVDGIPIHTDTLKRTFDKVAKRSKIPQQFTAGKEQTKT